MTDADDVFASLLIAAVAAAAAPAFAQTATWNIDPAHSAATFAVRHMMVSTVRGEFGKMTGKVQFDGKDVKTVQAEATIETGSISTREPKRDEHLKSADFFDTAKYPTITFKSKRVEAGANGQFKLIGDLTMRGVTKEVALDVTGPTPVIKDQRGTTRIGASATTKVNRQDFGISWSRTLDAGGVVVGRRGDDHDRSRARQTGRCSRACDPAFCGRRAPPHAGTGRPGLGRPFLGRQRAGTGGRRPRRPARRSPKVSGDVLARPSRRAVVSHNCAADDWQGLGILRFVSMLRPVHRVLAAALCVTVLLAGVVVPAAAKQRSCPTQAERCKRAVAAACCCKPPIEQAARSSGLDRGDLRPSPAPVLFLADPGRLSQASPARTAALAPNARTAVPLVILFSTLLI